MENFLSTKFIFAILVTLMGFILVIMGRVESNVWFTFVEVIGGTYVVGNVVQKFAPPVEK